MGQTHVKVVAAIDFGTKNSGYAYCMKRGGEIKFDKEWTKGRVSTDILLDRQLQIAEAFGPEANAKYKESLSPDASEELADCVYLGEDKATGFTFKRKYIVLVLLFISILFL